ncbi:hypothetical protein [Pararobbsia alpina]|uniref:hypothetical protein n=1 Tax=Pararobbsia alpina TaxID=621374 RepID=UPI0039A72E5B
MRVRGPLLRWDRQTFGSHLRSAACSTRDCAEGLRGTHYVSALCRFASIYTILSRRSVRRHNAIHARAFIAVHCDEVASLLP